MAHLLRCLFYLEAKYNFMLSAVHVPGVENEAADAVSIGISWMSFFLLPPRHPESLARSQQGW